MTEGIDVKYVSGDFAEGQEVTLLINGIYNQGETLLILGGVL